ncbi:C-type lectin protein [Pisolithus marmoratus]|nr:C-type lectin protein [Pisolithus marmoratus]
MHTRSAASVSSSSVHSVSTSPSTPHSESPPVTYLLPPPILGGTSWKDFTAKLEKGSSNKILVSIQHATCVSDVKVLLQQLLTLLLDVIPAGVGARLVTAGEDGLREASASIDDFIQLHDGKATPVTPAEALNMFSAGGLRSIYSVFSTNGFLTLHCLEYPQVSFPPLLPTCSSYSPFGIPTLDEWRNLWAAWDLVTLAMIPHEMLHQKPIDLRHKCLFYIGHIPTFLDMLMSAALKESNTEPKNFTLIFERGIDPHVDDPEHCHRHSEVPEKDEDWPSLGSVIAFRDRVRARLLKLYDDFQNGNRKRNRHIARMLAMTHEHEGWHVETLLYMLIQRAGTGTLPPPGFTIPPWEALAEQWNTIAPPSTSTVTIGPAKVTLGHEDCEGEDFSPEVAEIVDGHAFGWDNESPARVVEVKQIKMEWRPVTNREFFTFYKDNKQVGLPASWIEDKGEIMVRTVYGPVSMAVAQHWPVLTSYDALLAYAISKGGRLPTEPELRLFFDRYEVGHRGGANVGFRNWHPVPATTGQEKLGSRGSNGGIWEWTSTPFSSHEGLFPTDHFPGYSTDFHDGKHHVVLGASYATIPRLAERRTVRNFYQHNYPYAWVGARIVYDILDV